MLETSLRHMDERNPYHLPNGKPASYHYASPPSHQRNGHQQNHSISSFHPTPPTGRHRHTPTSNAHLALFSPPLQQRRSPIGMSRGGYATDSEIGYYYGNRRAEQQIVCSNRLNESGGSETAAERSHSPANSVASTSRSLGKPQPLQLRNIELLLKQLEESDASAAGRISPGNTSSVELSPPEAERHSTKEAEECSNTESARGGSVQREMHKNNLPTASSPNSDTFIPHRDLTQSAFTKYNDATRPVNLTLPSHRQF